MSVCGDGEGPPQGRPTACKHPPPPLALTFSWGNWVHHHARPNNRFANTRKRAGEGIGRASQPREGRRRAGQGGQAGSTLGDAGKNVKHRGVAGRPRVVTVRTAH